MNNENMNNKIAVVSGSNRGIGKEVVKQLVENGFIVIATGRNIDNLKKVFRDYENQVIVAELDVDSQKSCDQFGEFLVKTVNKIDVLVNNAGIMGEKPISEFDLEEIEKVMNTNFYGALRLTKTVIPILKKSGDARIINVSSGMGELESLNGSYAAYRLSKWGLNGLTLMLANGLSGNNIKVNAMCPGWCQTDMGGAGATRTAAKGAETIIWLATSCNSTGKFFRDKHEINW